MKRARGRPRQYDESSALAAACDVFWTKGFSATSLDDLASAMHMNRPSIYRAFGDKETLYRRALVQFMQGMQAAFAATMLAEERIEQALTQFYRAAVATYTAGAVPRGCMVMSTAVTAATCHPEIRDDVLAVIRELDAQVARRLQRAVDDGQLPQSFDCGTRARIAQGLLHSLSLRARAGEPPKQLQSLIDHAVALVLS